MLRSVRVVLFDFDDTLVRSSVADEGALRATLHRFVDAFGGGRVEDLVRAHASLLAEVKREFHATGAWAFPPERYARLLAERGGDAGRAEEIGRFHVAERTRLLVPYEGVPAFLAALRASAFRLGVVTNGPARQREAIRAVGFEGAFEAFAIAGEVGVRKPDPRLLRHAWEALGSPDPATVLVVGDSLEMDVRPARGLGMRTAFVAGADGDERIRLFDRLSPAEEADAAASEADLVVARATDLGARLL